MTPLPLWVGSPEIQSLLHLLVDRLDSAQARGTMVQSVALTDKTWPGLYGAPRESRKEALWENVQQLCQWGWLKVTPIGAVSSVCGYDHSPRVSVMDETSVRKAVARPERIRSPVERWREAIDQHLQGSLAVKKAAGEFCIDMPERSMNEVVERLNALKSIAGSPLLLREVSARLFWGMSKVLDNRQGLVAALLEADECPFAESPIQLQVYLPDAGFSGVLFIENMMSFEQANRSGSNVFSNLALVYASGFKGSAQRLRRREGASLYYSSKGMLGGPAKDVFESWLFDGKPETPAFFWGDLDWSGMRILAAMRSTFPSLGAWQPGYAPMLAHLVAGQGHSPEAADKKGQRALQASGCPFADAHLLPELFRQERFVDQELFTF